MEEDMRHRRINDAYSLMNDILSSKPVIQPIPSLYSAARPISPRAVAKERALKEKEKKMKKRNQQLSKLSKSRARVPVPLPASPEFKYSLPKKTRERSELRSEAKAAVSVTVTDSDASKQAKKVQFSNTQGMCVHVSSTQSCVLCFKFIYLSAIGDLIDQKPSMLCIG